MDKPSLPKGTRDFGPAVMARRQYILQHITSVYRKFGFQPLETPAMENLSTLTGKYGEEGDQLLFRILDTGDFLSSYKKTEGELFATKKTGEELIAKDKLTLYATELYNSVNEKVGPNKNQPIEVIGEYLQEAISQLKTKTKEEQLLIKHLYETDPEGLKRSIHSWLTTPLTRDQSPQELAREFFINRNEEVNRFTNLKPEFLRNFISEKGLRYDLTVPFARYVVMNKHDIAFPFKRYQVQPVWRADRPQKGRYREFYQCDADVVGTDSLICEAEIILMIKEVMTRLGVSQYSIKINHRGVLNGIAEVIGAKGKEMDLFVAIDKLDKIGEDKVREELISKNFDATKLDLLFAILNTHGSNQQKISFLEEKFRESEAGKKGTTDLQTVFNLLTTYQANDENVELDIALARGLSYYTGCIFEVKIANGAGIGSVSGGGRYDNLTASFGDKENLSGVGFSFGVDRLYDVLEELKLFPKETQVSSRVLICHFDEASQRYGLSLLAALREQGIAAEIYPDQAKLKKQLDYANKKMIPFTIVIGSDEMNTGLMPLKNMETGEQEKLSREQILQKLN